MPSICVSTAGPGTKVPTQGPIGTGASPSHPRVLVMSRGHATTALHTERVRERMSDLHIGLRAVGNEDPPAECLDLLDAHLASYDVVLTRFECVRSVHGPANPLAASTSRAPPAAWLSWVRSST